MFNVYLCYAILFAPYSLVITSWKGLDFLLSSVLCVHVALSLSHMVFQVGYVS